MAGRADEPLARGLICEQPSRCQPATRLAILATGPAAGEGSTTTAGSGPYDRLSLEVSGLCSTVPGVENESSVDRLRALLDELLAIGEDFPEQAQIPRGRPMDPVRLRTIIALGMHTVRLSRAVATLTDAGMHLETGPTVRSVLEFGLTAQWMVQYGEETSSAFFTEAQRQRRALKMSIEEVQKIMQLDAAALLDLMEQDMRFKIDGTSADQSARHFQKLCEDFANGKALYMVYRLLSGLVHVGPTVVEGYVDAEDGPLSFRTEATHWDDDKIWLSQTCCGLVWALRAVDMLDRKHPRRERLRPAARELGIPLELRLSTDARVCREQDRQRRKREERAKRTDEAS